MPPLEDIKIQEEKEDEANPKLNDMELEGIDLQGIVEAFSAKISIIFPGKGFNRPSSKRKRNL
jgi:hypothetical protein